MNDEVSTGKKNTVITVTVDLKKLKDGSKCKEFTTFTDNRDNSSPRKPDDIDSRVNRGKRILWIGNLEESLNEDDFIDILVVAKKKANQNSLLKRDFYLGDNGIIEGKVRKKKELGDALKNIENEEDGEIKMNYSISMLIGYKDSENEDDPMNYKICTLDPKIKMSK